MVLPRLDKAARSRLAMVKDARLDSLGLPVLLSVAGILIVFVLTAAAGFEHWLAKTTGPTKVRIATVAPENGKAALFNNLSRQIDTLHSKIDRILVDYQKVSADNVKLAQRLAELENQLGPYTGSITQRQPRPLDQEVLQAGKQDQLSVQFKTTQSSSSGTMTDGETAIVRTVKLGERSTQTLFALKLPRFRSIRELTYGWRNIQNRTGHVLAGLEPRSYATRDRDDRTVYQLVAGPIRNAADAATRCARLQEIGVSCETTVFAGERVVSLLAN